MKTNPPNLLRSILTFLLAVNFCSAMALADLKVASPFTDHMVLQQKMKIPVWGWATPGENITVTFAGQTQSATAAADGAWRVDLDAMDASFVSRSMQIAGGTDSPITLTDVLVGEVWLCSGQSNMDFTVYNTPKYYFAGTANEDAEVAAANYPNLRMFSGLWTKAYEPQQTIKGEWKICNPENVKEFSAIGYFFARDLQKELNVPVGILTETFGASTAEAWVRREALMADPDLAPMLPPFDAAEKAYRALPPSATRPAPAATQSATQTSGRRGRGPRVPADPAQNQHNPTVMYNGMIAPIIPYAIRGVLWYQGESILGPNHATFVKTNEVLITDWRKLWGYDFPFFFCQLAALDASSNTPAVREMQSEALSIPHTGMAVTIDIGDKKNVHPKDKQDVGLRLMKIALAKVYGKDIEYSGPIFDSMKIEGSTIRISFTHAKGLMAKGEDLKTFEIAGSDGKYFPATATIDGETVIVSSPAVTAPVSARYAWANYPDGCNLYNGDGLPAAPFRTDGPRETQ